MDETLAQKRMGMGRVILGGLAIAAIPLGVLLIVEAVWTLVFSVLIFATEPRYNIPSFGDALYLVIITQTTTGYGDIIVQTLAGKAFTVLLLIVQGLCASSMAGAVAFSFAAAAGLAERPVGAKAALQLLGRGLQGTAAWVAGIWCAWLLLALPTLGLVLYFVEPRDGIPDLADAMWFIYVTGTTVGYGDITPVTFVGKAVASLTSMAAGLPSAMMAGLVACSMQQVAKRSREMVM